MTTKNGGGAQGRDTAATEQTRCSTHEAGQGKSTTSHRASAPITADDDQYEINYDEALSAAERFEGFHHQNPAVYTVLTRLAREWITRAGRCKIGIGMLYKRARWEIALTTNDPEYKLNSEWTEEILDRLIDYRYRHEKPTLITTNHIELVPKVGERVASRLAEMCTQIAMSGSDRRRPS